jgi:hypothetical protein
LAVDIVNAPVPARTGHAIVVATVKLVRLNAPLHITNDGKLNTGNNGSVASVIPPALSNDGIDIDVAADILDIVITPETVVSDGNPIFTLANPLNVNVELTVVNAPKFAGKTFNKLNPVKLNVVLTDTSALKSMELSAGITVGINDPTEVNAGNDIVVKFVMFVGINKPVTVFKTGKFKVVMAGIIDGLKFTVTLANNPAIIDVSNGIFDGPNVATNASEDISIEVNAGMFVGENEPVPILVNTGNDIDVNKFNAVGLNVPLNDVNEGNDKVVRADGEVIVNAPTILINEFIFKEFSNGKFSDNAGIDPPSNGKFIVVSNGITVGTNVPVIDVNAGKFNEINAGKLFGVKLPLILVRELKFIEFNNVLLFGLSVPFSVFKPEKSIDVKLANKLRINEPFIVVIPEKLIVVTLFGPLIVMVPILPTKTGKFIVLRFGQVVMVKVPVMDANNGNEMVVRDVLIILKFPPTDASFGKFIVASTFIADGLNVPVTRTNSGKLKVAKELKLFGENEPYIPTTSGKS